MGKYSRFKYSRDVYGGNPANLEMSIQPFSSVVLDYGDVSGRVSLTWAKPTGAFTAMRIVRNQNAFPETAEDGIIIFDVPNTSAFSNTITRGSYTDENAKQSVPFSTGRFAYYRAWLKKANNVWYPAGDTYVLVPSPHAVKTARNTVRTGIEESGEAPGTSEGPSGSSEYSNVELLSTHERVIDLLPRVYTSVDHTALDEIDPLSALYTFIRPFSLTLDESLTYADLLKPDAAGRGTNPEILDLQAQQLGIRLEPGIASKAQKKLIREARYIYSRKGTALGLGAAVESMTGWAPSVDISPNLLLTIQDSSFKENTGFWAASAGATIEAVNTEATPATEPKSIDREWSAKVVVSSANATISNGNTSVFTQGIPVTENNGYTFSYYVKKSASTGAVVSYISWYDQYGELVQTDEHAGTTASTSWSRELAGVFAAPAGSVYASVSIKFVSTGTYYVDMVQLAGSTSEYEREYHEARAVEVTVDPSKVNYIANSSFQNSSGGSTSGWTIDGTATTEDATTFVTALPTPAATTQVSAPYSAKQLKVVTPTGPWEMSYDVSDALAITGAFYTFSIYVKNTSGSQSLQLSISATDGSTTVSHTSEVFELTEEKHLNVWTRLQVSKFIPATINKTNMVITVSVTGTTSGNTLNFDAAQLENSYYASDYFDGSYGPLMGASWLRDAYTSPSVLYPNRSSKIPNLVEEVSNYLPMNTPCIISTVGRVEFKLVT